MQDKRMLMCNELNFISYLRGQFIPCIGIDLGVNYVYKSAKVTLTLAEFKQLYCSMTRCYKATVEWNVLSRKLVDDKFFAEHKSLAEHMDEIIDKTRRSMLEDDEKPDSP